MYPCVEFTLCCCCVARGYRAEAGSLLAAQSLWFKCR